MSMRNPKKAKFIEIGQKELEDPENVATFISIFGRKKYLDALYQFSVQRLGDGTAHQLEKYMADYKDSISEEEYENELRPKMEEAESKIVPYKIGKKYNEAWAKVPLSGHETDENFRERFLDLLGTERYLEAMGLQNLEGATEKSMWAIRDDISSYSERQSAESLKKVREAEARAEQRKQRKEALVGASENGQED